MALDFPDSSTDGSFRTPSSIRAKLLKLTVASCNRKAPSAAASRRQPAAAMLSTQRAIMASASVNLNKNYFHTTLCTQTLVMTQRSCFAAFGKAASQLFAKLPTQLAPHMLALKKTCQTRGLA